MRRFDVENEMLATNPVDLSELEAMADTYYLAHHEVEIDDGVSEIMVAMANDYVQSKVGKNILFLSGIYAVIESDLLHEVKMLATVKDVIPSRFLDAPLDRQGQQVWHENGLAMTVEPHDEVLEEAEMQIHELNGWGSLWSELILPINQNVIWAANPMLGPPPEYN